MDERMKYLYGLPLHFQYLHKILFYNVLLNFEFRG